MLNKVIKKILKIQELDKSRFGLENRIYFDSASAVPVLEIAQKSFLEIIEHTFANPSSIHFEGEKAKDVLYEARKKIAKFLHTKPHTVYFTGSTTEANNIFIKGVVLNVKTIPGPSFVNEGNVTPHVIYSKSDHSAIVDVVENCKFFGAELTSIIPNKIGLLLIEEILKNIKENTKLICFSYVSSELGTVQPVRKIVQAVTEYCKKNFPNKSPEDYPKIFVDATQAVKFESMDVMNLGVDGLSFSGSKLGSVSGTSVLYVRQGVKLFPIISGGGQEEGVRSGTENLASIHALGKVLENFDTSSLQKNKEYISELRNYCIEKISSTLGESVEIFGDTKFKYNKFFEHSSPHILLLSLKDMLGEETLLRLDAKGVSVSTASACSLLENSGSNFLKAIREPVKAKETIRLSFSEKNTKEEIDYFVDVLKHLKDKFIKNS